MDQPVTIRVNGLKPGEPITLRASTTDYMKRDWTAQATFMADRDGIVDVSQAAPKYGSYAGVHAMGLVWSLQPQGVTDPASTYFIPSGGRYAVNVQAEADGRVLAQVKLIRYYLSPNVTRTIVASDGLVGEFYRPKAPGRHPAVLILGGSEGGLHPQVDEAALFAAHGYAALGVAYFQGYGNGNAPDLAHLPKMLVNIPLEYFVRATDWLKRQPGVDPHRIAIMGWSRGAEAALTTAAQFPHEFQAAIAFMPSSVVWLGINNETTGQPSPAWTLHGKPVPWMNMVVDQAAFAPGKPIVLAPMFAAALKNSAAVNRAAIPVERITGPVLLISAGDDKIWPSSMMARQIMRRLNAHRHPYHDESVCYAAAGHDVLPPWRPTNASAFGYPGGSMVFGGNPIAYAFADQDAWNHVLAFLRTSLGGSGATSHPSP